MLDQILDLKLEYYCAGESIEDSIDELDEDQAAYGTSLYLIKHRDKFIIGDFVSDYQPESNMFDFEGLTFREYLGINKTHEVNFQPEDGGNAIEMEDLNDIIYFTLLEDKSFLPLAIKEDDEQPMRAMMHFIYDEMAKSEMKDEEFIDYLQASARQIQESMKADEINDDF